MFPIFISLEHANVNFRALGGKIYGILQYLRRRSMTKECVRGGGVTFRKVRSCWSAIFYGWYHFCYRGAHNNCSCHNNIIMIPKAIMEHRGQVRDHLNILNLFQRNWCRGFRRHNINIQCIRIQTRKAYLCFRYLPTLQVKFTLDEHCSDYSYIFFFFFTFTMLQLPTIRSISKSSRKFPASFFELFRLCLFDSLSF